jgi:hypothetical protein
VKFKAGDRVQPTAQAREFLASDAIAVPSVVHQVRHVEEDDESVRLDPETKVCAWIPVAWLEPYTPHTLELSDEAWEHLPELVRRGVERLDHLIAMNGNFADPGWIKKLGQEADVGLALLVRLRLRAKKGEKTL